MGDIKRFLAELVAVWREHVVAAREQALATTVLAENVAALREAVEQHTEWVRRTISATIDQEEEHVQ